MGPTAVAIVRVIKGFVRARLQLRRMPSGFSPTSNLPAIVVGAGIAGLSLANALHGLGIPFVVVERRPLDAPADGHVLLYPPALEQLGAWGVAEPLLAEGRRLRKLTRVRPDGPQEHSDLAGARFPFVLAVSRDRLLQVLRDRLPAEALRGRCEVVRVVSEDDQVVVDVRLGDSMQVEVLRGTVAVGCDGSGSLLRRRLKIGFDLPREEQAWVTAEVSPAQDAFLVGPDWARVPLGGGRERWVLALGDTEDGLELDRAEPLAQAASARWDGVPVVDDVSCYRYFSMQERVVQDWRKGRVFLAGRSAHLTSPLWDADASLSVADAALLAEHLAAGQPDLYGAQRRAALERHLAPQDSPWMLVST